MKILKSGKILAAVTILFCNLSLQAQVESDFQFARNLNQKTEKKGIVKQFSQQISGNQNELDALFSGLFLFYKLVLSSQDNSVCSFHPSCSEYGLMSIKKRGLIVGGIMTFDRLTRCNGLSPENYEINMSLRKLNDPVK